jgi:hypothetical protein
MKSRTSNGDAGMQWRHVALNDAADVAWLQQESGSTCC